MSDQNKLTDQAIELLKKLIATQSFSSQEEGTAAHIEAWFVTHKIPFTRTKNNVWAVNKYFEKGKPTLLLNSHHDTVQPNTGYTRDPFDPQVEDGKLFGLGSNDAGGCLVSLIATFTHFYEQENLKYNLVLVASAEEESSSKNGLNSMLPIIPKSMWQLWASLRLCSWPLRKRAWSYLMPWLRERPLTLRTPMPIMPFIKAFPCLSGLETINLSGYLRFWARLR